MTVSFPGCSTYLRLQLCNLHLPFRSQAKSLLQAINLQGIFTYWQVPQEELSWAIYLLKLKTTPPPTSLGVGSRSQFFQFRNEWRVVCLCMQAQTNINCWLFSPGFFLYKLCEISVGFFHFCISAIKLIKINWNRFSKTKTLSSWHWKSPRWQNESHCWEKRWKDRLSYIAVSTSWFVQWKSPLPTCRKLVCSFLKALLLAFTLLLIKAITDPSEKGLSQFGINHNTQQTVFPSNLWNVLCRGWACSALLNTGT